MLESGLLTRLLKPILGFILRRGVTFKQFVNAAKALYIAVAEEELRRCGSPVNTSSISVLTGIHRSDVRELLGKPPVPEAKPSVISSIISRWESDPRFCTREGRPRILKIGGQKSEFRELVLSVTTHTDPASILREMERTQNIQRHKDTVELVRGELRAGEDVLPLLETLAKDLEALIGAVEQNLFQPIPGFSQLHISTEYDNIILEDIPKLRAWLVDHGKSFHREARSVISQSDADIVPRDDSAQAGGGVVVGTYAYVRPIIVK